MMTVDNAPGHPHMSTTLIKMLFLNSHHRVISNIKSYFLRRTFSQLLNENENLYSMKAFWKAFNILHAVNIVYACKEV